MKRMWKRALASVVALAMLPAVSFSILAETAEAELLINESFNEYVTDSKPENLDIEAKDWSISDYTVGEKGIIATTDGIETRISFAIPATKNVVMSFDIKATEKMPEGDFIITDSKGQTQTLLSFVPGKGAKAYNNISVSGFDKTRLTNYVIVYRAEDKSYDIYVNGSLKINNAKIKSATVEDVASFEWLFGIGTEGHSVIIDNVNAYEGKAHTIKKFPKAMYNYTAKEPEMTQEEQKLDLTKATLVEKDETAQREMLAGKYVVHTRSGVAIDPDGNKTLLGNTPYINDGKIYVPLTELCTAWGIEVPSGVTANGEGFANLSDLATALGLNLYTPEAEINSGLAVLASDFVAPEGDELQSLNNYAYYLRASEDTVLEAYNNSAVKNVHPRLLATQSDFDRMRAMYEAGTDEAFMIWANQVIAFADSKIGDGRPAYEELSSSGRTLQRKLKGDVYAWAMAYHLTGDMKYVEETVAELTTFCEFDSWYPEDHLHTIETIDAFSIAYDWLYNALTPDERKLFEENMYEKGFVESYKSFLSGTAAMGWGFVSQNNHGTVCNGGITMAAVAFMDVYPEECAWFVSKAMKGMEFNIDKWHTGAWYEGAGYWEYAAAYTIKFIESLRGVLGTDFGFATLEGLDVTAEMEIAMHSSLGIYNYADAGTGEFYSPEMLWFASEFDNSAVSTKVVMEYTNAFPLSHRTKGESIALAILWYDPEMIDEEANLDLDCMIDSIDTLLMRDTWNSQESTFVGIHAGETKLDHSQLDGGSFIYETAGVRWAVDSGIGDYNSLGYFDSGEGGNRWIHLRNRAEAHNTIITSPEGKHEDHVLYSFADQKIMVQKPKGVISTVDMTELLYDVSKATRGFAFTDNRQSLVIRDEVSLTKETDVYWFMQSKASGEIDGNSIILSQDGVAVKVEWTANAPIEATYEPISALPTSPEQVDKWSGDGIKRLALKMTTGGDVNITVKITPVTLNGASTLADWDKPIAEWDIPDGELPEKPVLDTISVAGREIEAGKTSTVKYSVVEEEYNTPPEVTATSDKYDIKIEQAKEFGDTATVTVTDKNDPTNVRVYNVVCEIIRKPIEIEGKVSIPVCDYAVSEIPQPENAPINLFDGNQSTRWSAEGYGQWIKLDLGSVQKINEIAMAFMGGHTRKTRLVFSISDDGENWTQIKETLSSGTSQDLEFFDLGDVSARYIKIGCNGNTSAAAESWNSITEIVVTRNK